MLNRFGDVVSSNLTVSGWKNAETLINSDFRLYLGQIEKIYPTNSPEVQDPNLKNFVLFDVRIKTAAGGTEIIPFCRMAQPSFGGGINNFFEVVPTDPGAEAADFTKTMEQKPGHFCVVGLLNGQRRAGVILATLPHPNAVAIGRRPDASKGVHAEGEIQGLGFQINNDGELIVTFNGPRAQDGKLVKEDIGPTTIQIDKTGNLIVSTNAEQTIKVDRTAKTITIVNGTTSLTMDQGKKQIDVVAEKVNVGQGSLQHQVVGDDLVGFLKELIGEIGSIIVPTGTGPSGTPINAPKLQALSAKIEQTILSNKHWVEK